MTRLNRPSRKRHTQTLLQAVGMCDEWNLWVYTTVTSPFACVPLSQVPHRLRLGNGADPGKRTVLVVLKIPASSNLNPNTKEENTAGESC